MQRKNPKWMDKVLQRPYAVKSLKGEFLMFADMSEAHDVSRRMRWMYYVFNISARSWIPVGIID